MRRLAYTIGYADKQIGEFLDILKARGVKVLIDVRYNAVSCKPEFSKSRLKEYLEANGIRYLHVRELGVPRAVRNRLIETGDYEWFFRWYDDNVIAAQTERLNELLALDCPFVIMCAEPEPFRCHRARIAEWLREKGFEVYDI